MTFRDSLVAKKDMRPRSDSEVVIILFEKTFPFPILKGAAAAHQKGDAEHTEGRIQGQVRDGKCLLSVSWGILVQFPQGEVSVPALSSGTPTQ